MQHAQSQQLEQSRAAREQQRPSDFEHWLEIGKRVDDHATAEIIVDFMDRHPTVKARLGGLYVRAQDTLQQRRVALGKEVAEQLEREYANRRRFFQNIGRRALEVGNLAYRSIRLVFRGARDLLHLIQKVGTISHVQPAMAKGNLHGRRA